MRDVPYAGRFVPSVAAAEWTRPASHAADRTWWVLTAGLLAVLLLPLLLVPLPPILDYPNHLARMFVLANGPADPFLSRVYAQHWDIIPNLGIDLIIPPMLSVMSVYTAGRIMLGVALLMPVIGTIVYSRAAFGRWSPWSIGSGLVAYNLVFLLGFMNFLTGIGAALLAAAAWIRWRSSHPFATVAAMTVLALGIFFIHIFGLLFLGLLIGCAEVTAAWTHRRRPAWLRSALPRFSSCALVFAAPVALYLASPLGHATEAPAWRTPMFKTIMLFAPLLNYAGRADIAVAPILAAIIYFCVSNRWAAIAPGAVLAGAVLMLLYPLVPFRLEAAFFDTRLPVMAAFLVFAGFAPTTPPRPVRVGIAVTIGGMFLARMAFLTTVWIGQSQDIADFRSVIANVPPASRVLVTRVSREDNVAYWNAMPRRRFLPPDSPPAYMHLPGLLVIERDSIWPLLFTVPAKQPLRVLPAYRGVTEAEGVVPSYRVLRTDEPSPNAIRTDPYLAGWPAKFDYVLILAAGGAGDLTQFRPDRLQLLARTDIAALFRIRQ